MEKKEDDRKAKSIVIIVGVTLLLGCILTICLYQPKPLVDTSKIQGEMDYLNNHAFCLSACDLWDDSLHIDFIDTGELSTDLGLDCIKWKYDNQTIKL
jgi:hypothetical protein